MTASKFKVLFYDDAPNFGGHEFMTLQLVAGLSHQDPIDIIFIVSDLNSELRHKLGQVVPAVGIQMTTYASGRGQWLRSYLSIRPLLHLTRRIRGLKPDLLVVVQGGIALSSLGLLAGRLAGVRTISYIPMTHDERIFASSPLRARFRQWCVQPFYSLPHCLVTISARMAEYAAARRSGSVRVVENGIVLPTVAAAHRGPLRAELGLKECDQLLLMVGRIEFWQKRHDLAVEALSIARSRGVAVHLLVVGSGPDEEALRSQVQALGLAGFVHFRSWQADVSAFYAACDRLLLPSRYEGVPLVMLEAMHAGRKILAADVDGMADMLPPDWKFPAGDAPALASAICAPDSAKDATHVQRHQGLIATKHTISAFRKRFHDIIQEEVELSRG